MEGIQQESFSIPTMYGDHHVSRVRQIVTALPGITDIRASASRKKLTLKFDAGLVSVESISTALAQGGFAPGAQPVEAAGSGDDLPIVMAADLVQVREAKYSPPPAFGVCPGLETRYVGSDHPADHK